MPNFATPDTFYTIVKDAVSSIRTFTVALGWVRPRAAAAPDLQLVRPKMTRDERNLGMMRAFLAQSSMGIDGFDVGGSAWEPGGGQFARSLGQDVVGGRVGHVENRRSHCNQCMVHNRHPDRRLGTLGNA